MGYIIYLLQIYLRTVHLSWVLNYKQQGKPRPHASAWIWSCSAYASAQYGQIKKSDIFHISAQNIDCGYSLEPPR